MRKVLVQHVGTEAMMFWRLERGITTIVGIVGPEGSVPPTSEPAAEPDKPDALLPASDDEQVPPCMQVDEDERLATRT